MRSSLNDHIQKWNRFSLMRRDQMLVDPIEDFLSGTMSSSLVRFNYCQEAAQKKASLNFFCKSEAIHQIKTFARASQFVGSHPMNFSRDHYKTMFRVNVCRREEELENFEKFSAGINRFKLKKSSSDSLSQAEEESSLSSKSSESFPLILSESRFEDFKLLKMMDPSAQPTESEDHSDSESESDSSSDQTPKISSTSTEVSPKSIQRETVFLFQNRKPKVKTTSRSSLEKDSSRNFSRIETAAKEPKNGSKSLSEKPDEPSAFPTTRKKQTASPAKNSQESPMDKKTFLQKIFEGATKYTKRFHSSHQSHQNGNQFFTVKKVPSLLRDSPVSCW